MNKPKSRTENIVVQEMNKEILIYDLKTNQAFCLNETSATIYQLCDGKNSVTEISQTLNKLLKQPITEDVVWLALNDFKKDNLLEQSEQFEINFNGLNRRQIIKKIGFASMILLPVISSIVAPNAAMAASGCVNPGGVAPGNFIGPPIFAPSGSCPNANSLCNAGRGGSCCSGLAGSPPGQCLNTPNDAIVVCACL